MLPRPTNSIPLRDGEASCPEDANHRASTPSATPSDRPATALGSRSISPRQSSAIANPGTNAPEPSAEVMPSPSCSPCKPNTPLGTTPCPKPSPAPRPRRRSRPSSNSTSKHSRTSSRRAATAATDVILAQSSTAACIRRNLTGRSHGMGCRASLATPGRRPIKCQRMFGSPLSTPSAAEGGGRRPAFTEDYRTAILAYRERRLAVAAVLPDSLPTRPRNAAVYARSSPPLTQDHRPHGRSDTQRSVGFYSARSGGNSIAIDTRPTSTPFYAAAATPIRQPSHPNFRHSSFLSVRNAG